MGDTFDFSGWATRNDLRCSDGRTIRKDAFKEQDGLTVPLVWNHKHDESFNVLGHAVLENKNEGVYAYCKFNDTEAGKNAKLLVQHGDVNALSIYANQLRESPARDVLHGIIREVSLVLAGANPGAMIDTILAHSDEDGESAVIYTGESITLDDNAVEHACGDSKEEPKKKELEHAKEGEEEMATEVKNDSEKTVQDVFDTLTEDQKTVVYAIIGQAIEDAKGGKKEDEESEGGKNMKHNVFENDEMNQDALIHDGLEAIVADAKRCGSLKESYLQHAAEYGIDNIDWLFPDAKNLENQPGFIKRNPDEWVSVVMNGVHHTPFSRIKMMFADLREDDARAKGYATKGQLKKEEVFGLLKRTVDPTTIYKKQKLDRDDMIDITDFDVVSWLKGEMRMMLDEEIARAILFGDGRSASSPDKIKATSIIPVCADASLYNITQTLPSNYTARDLIVAAIKGQNDYEGSGNTIMFTSTANVTDMLLIEDDNKRRIYNTVTDLALACSVSRVVKVPATVMPSDVAAVIVDLNDYNVGADKGGAINMFDDFDIDYNQEKYLIETRCSGALRKPFSAVTIKKPATQAAG